ncbi:DUF3794 domain-containing protein [Selenihalanaerobacter shriftii]|uniref:SipL SPOCS domain-containing protein n=1 Tax=Selenihalanaerobacter shriftii TaxID=142842 RepID=A0A1T4N6Y1_9FIRM|nr:DUF3794 domain-containing protein [Selenihalanaerobacter shriftii]SJZ74923.1 hypothetical protein SAMN02745118_01718 [Selenihalanaerobacter shriftii]
MYTSHLKNLRVIGEEIMQIVEGARVDLTAVTPGNVEAVAIADVLLEVDNVTEHIFRNKVVKQGDLIVNIIFKGSDGVMYHATVALPFEEEVEIGGIVPGIKINGQVRVPVQDAEDTTLDIQNYILELDADATPMDMDCDGLFDTVHVKALARILVKVSRWEQMDVFVNGRDGVFRFSGRDC